MAKRRAQSQRQRARQWIHHACLAVPECQGKAFGSSVVAISVLRWVVVVTIGYAAIAMETTTLGNVTEELLGVTEIAAFVGISRQRVQKLTETDADFPEPVAMLARGRVWSREAIEEWARDTGRTVNRKA